MAAHGVVLPLICQSGSTCVTDGSWEEGGGECCKGQSRPCLGKWLKSVVFRVTALGRWFLVRPGEREGKFCPLHGFRCFSRSSSPQQCAALVQNLNTANRKKDPKIINRTYVLFPFPLYTLMFSKSKISVVLYRKANRLLHGDRKFPHYEWSVLIQIHLSICEVLMIWRSVVHFMCMNVQSLLLREILMYYCVRTRYWVLQHLSVIHAE